MQPARCAISCVASCTTVSWPARNRGAARASAPRILFLDDDMEATPTLVAAHLAAHAATPEAALLGYTPLAVAGGATDLWTVADRLWWSDRFTQLARPEHRFTF